MEKQQVEFKNAYFIKLGKGGIWETESLQTNKARIGWSKIDLDTINSRDWQAIRKHDSYHEMTPGAITSDLNALRYFVDSTPQDIWITFHDSCLWWCRFSDPQLYEDDISRFRCVDGKWSNKDTKGNTLKINQIPGIISKIQGFRGTICTINNDGKYKELDALRRLLNNQESKASIAISLARKELVEQVLNCLHLLYWKDFEILSDLVFSYAGWKRISTVGEVMKGLDMEYQDPITKDLFQVQVKSQASLSDFQKWSAKYATADCRRMYFVVHSPEPNLENFSHSPDGMIELFLPDKLAEMVVDFGLTNWLLRKIK